MIKFILFNTRETSTRRLASALRHAQAFAKVKQAKNVLGTRYLCSVEIRLHDLSRLFQAMATLGDGDRRFPDCFALAAVKRDDPKAAAPKPSAASVNPGGKKDAIEVCSVLSCFYCDIATEVLV